MRLMRGGTLHLLVIGAVSSGALVLGPIRNHLPAPVREYRRTAPNPESNQAGTITISDILAFSRSEQDALFQWLTASPHTSVMAFSAEPLWPFVRDEMFRTDLFYRLNIITIVLSSG
jgi:hypothetical protein